MRKIHEPMVNYCTVIAYTHHTQKIIMIFNTLKFRSFDIKPFWNLYEYHEVSGACGSVVGRDTMIQAGRSRDRIPIGGFFFNLHNPSSRIMVLGSTQPLTEMSTWNLPGGKGRPARKADNLSAVSEPIV
jgi:hypothetical protein